MPLYEYVCDDCGHRFEVIQKFSDPPIEQCPKCNGSVQKQFSSPAIQFKGSGWYITDYARKDQPGRGVASETSKNGAGTTSDAKSDKSDKTTTTSESSSSKATPASSSTPAAGKD